MIQDVSHLDSSYNLVTVMMKVTVIFNKYKRTERRKQNIEELQTEEENKRYEEEIWTE